MWKRKHRRKLAEARRAVPWVREMSREHGVSVQEILDGHDQWLDTLDDDRFEAHLFESCAICWATVTTVVELEGWDVGRV